MHGANSRTYKIRVNEATLRRVAQAKLTCRDTTLSRQFRSILIDVRASLPKMNILGPSKKAISFPVS